MFLWCIYSWLPRLVDPRNCPWPFHRATERLRAQGEGTGNIDHWYLHTHSQKRHAEPLLPKVTWGSRRICSEHISLSGPNAEIKSPHSAFQSLGVSYRRREQWEGTTADDFICWQGFISGPGHIQNTTQLHQFSFVRAKLLQSCPILWSHGL